MIIDHNSKQYQRRLRRLGADRYNGAYYYSKEIVDNIIPFVKTDRNWITVYPYSHIPDHSIFFVHNNQNEIIYNFVRRYQDVVLVCGIPETAEKMRHYGKVIYLPLSVDVDYVSTFRSDKRYDAPVFFGRESKSKGLVNTLCFSGMPREKMLGAMAEYRQVYAVGRTAIEAKILGCEVLPYDKRFPDPSRWEVLSNQDAAKLLQEKLEKIENGETFV